MKKKGMVKNYFSFVYKPYSHIFVIENLIYIVQEPEMYVHKNNEFDLNFLTDEFFTQYAKPNRPRQILMQTV